MSRFARYGWSVLAFNLLVILWGAYVRASGSGAGCGAHWPLCNGEVIPRAPRIETIIEMTHRLTSGVALILVVIQLVWARRSRPAGDAARFTAHVAMGLMITEALVGAGLVLFEMVAQNQSIARTYWLAAHLLNTFALVGALALVPWFASGQPAPRREALGAEGKLLFFALGGTLLLGMTGAITALGDTLFPAESLAAGIAQDAGVDISAAPLVAADAGVAEVAEAPLVHVDSQETQAHDVVAHEFGENAEAETPESAEAADEEAESVEESSD